MGWTVRGWNSGGGEIFRICPDRSWGPPCLLYNGYRVFPGDKERPGRDADLSSPSSAVGLERVELYLYSPYGPYGLYRASVPVQGCTLPFTYNYLCCHVPLLRTRSQLWRHLCQIMHCCFFFFYLVIVPICHPHFISSDHDITSYRLIMTSLHIV